MIYIVLIGTMSGFHHFSHQTVDYAVSKNFPPASFLVPVSGILAIAGAISIVLDHRARLGAWLIVVFLVLVTLMIHNFWAITDPMTKQVQAAMFMKKVSMLGGALLIIGLAQAPLAWI
jgi:putative oxidoreductase